MRAPKFLFPLALGVMTAAGPVMAVDLSPGLWEVTVQTFVPGAEFLASPPNQITQCLSASDARDPSQLIGSISVPGATDCSYTEKNYSRAAGTFRFAMNCAGSLGLRTQGDVTFTATSMNGNITATGNLGGQATELQNKVWARRLGGC